MNKIAILTFFAGAVAGSVVTYFISKDKITSKAEKEAYEKAEEDINEMREYYAKKNTTSSTSSKEETIDKNIKEIKEKASAAKEKASIVDYTNLAKKYNKNNDALSKTSRPYVISPYDFDNDKDHLKVYMTEYSDSILVEDETGEVWLPDKINTTIGCDYERYYGSFAPDELYIRNDDMCTDYDVCKDNSKFSDIYPSTDIEESDDMDEDKEDGEVIIDENDDEDEESDN